MTNHKHRRRKPRCPLCRAQQGIRHDRECPLANPGPPLQLSSCPDCGAEFDGLSFDHEECCPYLAGQDATSDDDRQYFEDHPGETVRVRPPFRAEQLENSHLNAAEPGSWVTHVTVTQIKPGYRRRSLHTAMFAVVVA